jgi:hypothetical protein
MRFLKTTAFIAFGSTINISGCKKKTATTGAQTGDEEDDEAARLLNVEARMRGQLEQQPVDKYHQQLVDLVAGQDNLLGLLGRHGEVLDANGHRIQHLQGSLDETLRQLDHRLAEYGGKLDANDLKLRALLERMQAMENLEEEDRKRIGDLIEKLDQQEALLRAHLQNGGNHGGIHIIDGNDVLGDGSGDEEDDDDEEEEDDEDDDDDDSDGQGGKRELHINRGPILNNPEEQLQAMLQLIRLFNDEEADRFLPHLLGGKGAIDVRGLNQDAPNALAIQQDRNPLDELVRIGAQGGLVGPVDHGKLDVVVKHLALDVFQGALGLDIAPDAIVNLVRNPDEFHNIAAHAILANGHNVANVAQGLADFHIGLKLLAMRLLDNLVGGQLETMKREAVEGGRLVGLLENAGNHGDNGKVVSLGGMLVVCGADCTHRQALVHGVVAVVPGAKREDVQEMIDILRDDQVDFFIQVIARLVQVYDGVAGRVLAISNEHIAEIMDGQDHEAIELAQREFEEKLALVVKEKAADIGGFVKRIEDRAQLLIEAGLADPVKKVIGDVGFHEQNDAAICKAALSRARTAARAYLQHAEARARSAMRDEDSSELDAIRASIVRQFEQVYETVTIPVAECKDGEIEALGSLFTAGKDSILYTVESVLKAVAENQDIALESLSLEWNPRQKARKEWIRQVQAGLGQLKSIHILENIDQDLAQPEGKERLRGQKKVAQDQFKIIKDLVPDNDRVMQWLGEEDGSSVPGKQDKAVDIMGIAARLMEARINVWKAYALNVWEIRKRATGQIPVVSSNIAPTFDPKQSQIMSILGNRYVRSGGESDEFITRLTSIMEEMAPIPVDVLAAMAAKKDGKSPTVTAVVHDEDEKISTHVSAPSSVDIAAATKRMIQLVEEFQRGPHRSVEQVKASARGLKEQLMAIQPVPQALIYPQRNMQRYEETAIAKAQAYHEFIAQTLKATKEAFDSIPTSKEAGKYIAKQLRENNPGVDMTIYFKDPEAFGPISKALRFFYKHLEEMKKIAATHPDNLMTALTELIASEDFDHTTNADLVGHAREKLKQVANQLVHEDNVRRQSIVDVEKAVVSEGPKIVDIIRELSLMPHDSGEMIVPDTQFTQLFLHLIQGALGVRIVDPTEAAKLKLSDLHRSAANAIIGERLNVGFAVNKLTALQIGLEFSFLRLVAEMVRNQGQVSGLGHITPALLGNGAGVQPVAFDQMLVQCGGVCNDRDILTSGVAALLPGVPRDQIATGLGVLTGEQVNLLLLFAGRSLKTYQSVLEEVEKQAKLLENGDGEEEQKQKPAVTFAKSLASQVQENVAALTQFLEPLVPTILATAGFALANYILFNIAA